MLPIADLNPTRSAPYVTYGLLAANLVAFSLSCGPGWLVDPALARSWGVVPAELVSEPSVVRLFSHLFLHEDPGHLAGNLLFLYIFGDNIEDALGPLRYLLFYGLGGVGAAAAHVAVDPTNSLTLIGASGAISAVLGGYLVLYPRARVLVWAIFVFQVPAWLMLGYWLVIQNLLPGLLSLGPRLDSPVAFFAHLGGFIVGVLLIRPLCHGRPPTPPTASAEGG